MKQKLQRLKGGRLGSQLFLKTFMLLAFMLSGIGSVLAQTATWTASAPNVVTCKATLTGQTTTTVNNVTATLNGIGADALEWDGKTFYKFATNQSYINLKRTSGDFHAGDKLKVTLGASHDGKDIVASFKLKAGTTDDEFNQRPNAVEATVNNSSVTLEYTLKSTDINDDGSISIYRAGGTGYACKYYEFSVEASDLYATKELSSNTDLVSVITGFGNWTYNSTLGITNYKQGKPTWGDDSGSCIIIRPKENIAFSLRTYSSASNCNLRMYDDANANEILKDFRQKGDATNDFGVLQKGKTYLIYGEAFKNEGNASMEYVFFKSFTATKQNNYTVSFSYTGDVANGNDITSLTEPVGLQGIVLPAAYNKDDVSGVTHPTEWTGRTDTYNNDTYYERYQTSSIAAGDVLTQTISGLKYGTYEIIMRVAASYTSGRGFTCPTGDDLTVAFANDKEIYIPVVDRGAVSNSEANLVSFIVKIPEAGGSITYGIKNKKASGNWYIARVEKVRRFNDTWFDGWYTEETGGTKVGDAGDLYHPTADQTLYARWKAGRGGYVAHPDDEPTTIGAENLTTGFCGAFSHSYVLGTNKELEFSFKLKTNTNNKAWNSFVMIATPTKEEKGFRYDYGSHDLPYLVLRPDNYGWGKSYTPGVSRVVLKGVGEIANPAENAQFRNDLNGATINAKMSYDGSMIFVYWTITNADGSRVYTYYQPTQNNVVGVNGNVQISWAVDLSQITDFQKVADRETRKIVSVVREVNLNDTFTNNDDAGTVVFRNEDDVDIPSGARIGVGTKIYMVAYNKPGYSFRNWSNGLQATTREFIVGSNSDTDKHTFYADFNKISNFETVWSLKNTAGQVYSENGTSWQQNGNWWDSRLGDNLEFTEIYSDEAHTTKVPGYDGVLFGQRTTITRQNDSDIKLYDNGGAIRIPVTTAGEIISFTINNANGPRNITVINGGTNVSCECVKGNNRDNGTNHYIIVSPEAVAQGYIEIRNTSDSTTRLWNLKRTLYYDFAFEDGNNVLAYAGTNDYVNEVVAVDDNLPLLAGNYHFTSSDPAVVTVDNDGKVSIKPGFTGTVQITATRESNGVYPTYSKSYTLTASTTNISFTDALVEKELGADGSVAVEIQKVNNVPDGYSVKYSIESTTDGVKAEVTSNENGNGWFVSVFGAGDVVVKAMCGALSATYTIHTYGFIFNETFPVYDFSGPYTQKILGDSYTDVHYEVANRIGKIDAWDKSRPEDQRIKVEDGTVKNLPAYNDNKGGSIIIHAWGLEGSVRKDAYYTLTVPYKKFTWNFYQENLTGNVPYPNLIQTLNADDHFTTGNIVNYTNPGAAGEVPMAANLDGVTYNSERATEKTKNELKRRKTWMDAQNDDAVKADASDPHNYWNYTFKTIQREADKKTIWYVNEPLFSYKGSVNGSNVAIVNETNGLIFNCAADKFGINDNKTYSTRDAREQDRAILIRGNSSFTVPFVQQGHYVKIHWYRHSDNSGDQFRVTNAVDLDGREINPDHVLRMTGSHYQLTNKEKDVQAVSKGYKGYTIVRAKETGDVTFTMANQGWTEIYTVEVTDEYSTELKVMHGYLFDDIWNPTDNWGGPMTGGYGTRPNGDGEMVDMDTNIISVVRDVDNWEDYNESDLVTTDYQNADSERLNHNKVNNMANVATQRVGKKPIIYIASYPGQTYGWNGWNLDVEATPMAEDAGNLSIGLKKDTWARLGNYLSYRYTALTNFHGTGTVHVVVRTKSNWEQNDGERYTLDMQEAYFPVGEYHSQTYPYTWDFTEYNMENGKKLSGSDNYTATHMGGSTAANYGGWNNYAMQTHASVPATVPANATATNHRTYNKFIFADGSQFTLNGTNAKYGNVKYSAKSGANEIRETDGLRVNLGNMTQGHSYQDGRLKMDENYGGFVLPNGSSITIPKVNHGMYIYIRSAQKPTSVVAEVANGIQEYGKESSNTITSTKVTFSPNDNDAVVALHGNDVLDNVWVYRVIAGSATSETFDVTVTPSAAIEGIGVTKYHKETVQLPGINEANRMTDARNENIDYHNTGFFTKHDLQAYIATNVHDMGGSHNEDGLVNIEPITVLPAKANSGSDKRGLVLEKTANGTGLTSRPRLPLFVPACNVMDDVLTGNLLVDCVASTDVPGYDKNSDNNIYILTNQHYDWDWEKNQWIAENVGTTVNPGSLADGWHVDSQATFYILRDGGMSRPNFAYLEVPKTPSAGVKNFYMIQGVEFSDEEATGIEAVDSDAEVAGLNDASEVYTVTGVKVAKPTKKGLYVINGKKVYVK